LPPACPERIFATSAEKFFKHINGFGIPGVMTRPGRELRKAGPPDDAAHAGYAQRRVKPFEHPPCQIDQPPARHPVDRRGRAALNDLGQRLSPIAGQPRPGPGGLAVDQPVRTFRVEPHHPVPNGLQPDVARLRRIAP